MILTRGVVGLNSCGGTGLNFKTSFGFKLNVLILHSIKKSNIPFHIKT